MSGKSPEDTAPSVIRAALRGHFTDLLPDLVEIARTSERDIDRVRAIELLARYGVGAAGQDPTVHIHAEGGSVAIGVVALPQLGSSEGAAFAGALAASAANEARKAADAAVEGDSNAVTEHEVLID